MSNNQNVLVAVIFALVVVIGFLVYDREYRHPETLGEKIGHSIDHATNELGNAIDEGPRRNDR